jgi:hypothetical protein
MDLTPMCLGVVHKECKDHSPFSELIHATLSRDCVYIYILNTNIRSFSIFSSLSSQIIILFVVFLKILSNVPHYSTGPFSNFIY